MGAMDKYIFVTSLLATTSNVALAKPILVEQIKKNEGYLERFQLSKISETFAMEHGYSTQASLFFRIASSFTIEEDREELFNFFKKNMVVARLISESKSAINKQFGDIESKLVFRVDPEEDFERVSVEIISSLPNREEKLYSFEDDWFLDQLPLCAGKLSFTVG